MSQPKRRYPLTPTQLQVLAGLARLADRTEGRIGGSARDLPPDLRFTATLDALARRGLIEWTDWRIEDRIPTSTLRLTEAGRHVLSGQSG